MAQREVWLRGAIDGVPPLLQPPAHSLLQCREEVERLAVDVIGADDGGEAAGDLRDGLRLTGVEPHDRRGVADRQHQSRAAGHRLTHADRS